MSARPKVIQLHLILGSVFLPLLLVIPLTGALHLLKVPEEQTKEDAFVINEPLPTNKEEHEAFFRKHFAANAPGFEFEYIKSSGTDHVFRPTSRVHYVASEKDGGLAVQKVTPNLLKRLMELHKGHGPTYFRWLETVFGLSLVLVAFSGAWLAATMPLYRKPMLISAGVGLILVIGALL